MKRGGPRTVTCDKLAVSIAFYMVFIAIMRLSVFLCPTCISILLCQFCSVFRLLPIFRNFTVFDFLVFLTRVALTRSINKCGINNCAGMCDHPFFCKQFIEQMKAFLDCICLREIIPEFPYCFSIRNAVVAFKSEKAHKAA